LVPQGHFADGGQISVAEAGPSFWHAGTDMRASHAGLAMAIKAR
jgi:hypothetical protein